MTARLFLSLEEAAEATRMSPNYLKGAVATGALKAKRTGPAGSGKYLFRPDDLQAWFDQLDAA